MLSEDFLSSRSVLYNISAHMAFPSYFLTSILQILNPDASSLGNMHESHGPISLLHGCAPWMHSLLALLDSSSPFFPERCLSSSVHKGRQFPKGGLVLTQRPSYKSPLPRLPPLISMAGLSNYRGIDFVTFRKG